MLSYHHQLKQWKTMLNWQLVQLIHVILVTCKGRYRSFPNEPMTIYNMLKIFSTVLHVPYFRGLSLENGKPKLRIMRIGNRKRNKTIKSRLLIIKNPVSVCLLWFWDLYKGIKPRNHSKYLQVVYQVALKYIVHLGPNFSIC